MPEKQQAHYTQPFEDTLEALGVSAEQGLPDSEVRQRRERYGVNRIRETGKRHLLQILLAQFRSVVVAILCGAGILAFAFGKTTEGAAILAVIVVNCLIGFVSEWRAERAMEALRKMGTRRSRVRRNDEEQEVPAASLVPGDICLLEGGDMVPADMRLVEANNLRADESTLTGESVSAHKRTDPVEPDQPLAERACMLYRGTTLTEGSAVGVVTATGMDTELGHIAEMTEEAAGEEHTPLERRLNRLGQRLAWVALGAAAVIGVTGLAAGKPTLLMIETAIALGVAAVPEGLPFVATIGLARGMWLMARRQALINRLPAVETLGATDVILSDKTGTLTENRMTAAVVATPGGEHDLQSDKLDKERVGDDACFGRALEIGALCNNASVSDTDGDGRPEEKQGDPTETALLTAAAQWDIRRDALLEKKPEQREEAFDPDVMMMATVHKAGDAFDVAVKGAPQAVLKHCDRVAADSESRRMDPETRQSWEDKAAALAGQGLRVLAFADKSADSPDDNPYDRLRFVALIGLLDPPRDDVREALRACDRAGIRVIMVTGDQPRTAQAIAADLGIIGRDDTVLSGSDVGDLDKASDDAKTRILETRVFARVSPEQKLHLLALFQEQGHTVAMTGDGVNDAPALKKADIGVAMGRRGSDAATESADMVLKNDAFSSILAAVEQGRIIFANIRKSVIFMMCTNVAEVAAVAVASLLNWPLPIRPLQILFLNVITDVFPALALSVGKGDTKKALEQPPRRADESVLGPTQWITISAWSAVIAVCVLVALMTAVHAVGMPVDRAVTVSFLTLALAKLWFVFNLRDTGSSLFHNDIVSNHWIWASLAACAALLAAAVYLPGLSTLLGTRPPGPYGWLTIAGLSMLPMLAGQARLVYAGR